MGCGACCIAISISSPMPGYPKGKPAGERCLHLSDDLLCKIFTSPERPKVCDDFKAEASMCGTNRDEALLTLHHLEMITSS